MTEGGQLHDSTVLSLHQHQTHKTEPHEHRCECFPLPSVLVFLLTHFPLHLPSPSLFNRMLPPSPPSLRISSPSSSEPPVLTSPHARMTGTGKLGAAPTCFSSVELASVAGVRSEIRADKRNNTGKQSNPSKNSAKLVEITRRVSWD